MACLLGAAQAQPKSAPAPERGNRLVGETIADRPSALYRYERHHLDSLDGKRRYRIELSIPRRDAPINGHAALYMLDGNAAMDTLTDDDLTMLADGAAPVLVAIGYDVPTRNDVMARSYDYTPAARENGRVAERPVWMGRPGGGADIFLAFIESHIKPLVHARAKVDPTREILWGHSFGGLFALHVLFMQPDMFDGYIAGDPSAWWHEGLLYREWEDFDDAGAAGKRLAILAGTRPREDNRPSPAAVPLRAKDGRQLDTPTALRTMAEGLRAGGAALSYETFPQHGHGDMLRVSLEHALRMAAEP